MPQLMAVDELVVDVIIDNVTDSYSSKPPNVTPEFNNVMEAGAKELSGYTLCCAQLGLALVLTAKVGKHSRKVLFDTGPEADLYLRNCRNLGVSLADAEAIAVSHGHWDHTGAMLEVLDHMARVNGGKEVPCHVNPGMFLDRGAILTNGQVAPFQPVATTDELASHGAALVNAFEQRVLSDDWFYLSGEIPRVSSFEKGRVDHLCRTSPQAAWQPDPLIMDERYLAVRIKNKGLLVFSACSHAGIINVLMDVREKFANIPIYGVFGGFHLAGKAMEALIPQTVAELKAFGLKQIMPAHCTGWRAVHALLNEFGEDVVVPSAVGSRFHY
jgi:7,8-dihydropterin-6-yl-methyl-4-(beta-D-ribofuranosyl)aminobenzene 5'-phosphate synthase